ncbi:coiled-coil domain-containing protein 138 [Aplysia californica]|uniref:Coiled-coil domain-containing protein 138 n=1 Tax=Aplysia californica TaxID=6500 RepID=A0ABM0ZXG7_APLCA|nr:coiled-coil domain-containing protein 138 [Aplysia californica]
MDQYLSDDSDIDELITPIGGSPHGSLRGQLLESDSPAEFVKKPAVRPRAAMKSAKGKSQTHKTRVKSSQPPSFRLDSDDGAELTREDIKGIYAELQAISDKLREENKILHEREVKLKERERMLTISQDSLQTITDHQIKVKMAAIEERLKAELSQMDQALKEKTKENKRLKENFETIKQANDVMKKEMQVLQAQNEKLTKTSSSMQARLANLQRKLEYEQKLKDADVMKLQEEIKGEQPVKDVEKVEEKAAKAAKTNRQATVQVYSAAVSALLDWVCEAHLRQALVDAPTRPSESYTTPAFIHERVIKILPSLVDILRDNAANVRCCLPCLQFVYWSLLHIDQLQQTQQNISMSTTTRRIGEEIYYPKSSKVTEVEKILAGPSLNEKLKDGLFLRSSNNHVRFLSALIILKTLSRADVLAQAFDVLKTELKSDQAKEYFLYYQATNVITAYLKPVNKTFIPVAVDVQLQMSADSPFQSGFLDSCSNETWFRAVALLIRTPLQDIRILERLSIILQKLSKLKTNKRFFEIYTIVAIIQEMLVAGGNDSAFLTLNLKSILFNLSVAVKS